MVGNPFFWVLHGSGWNLFHGSFYIHYKYAQVLPFVVRPITKCCYIPLSLVVCIQASVASTQLSVVSLIISTFEFFFLWLSTHILFLWHIPTARWPCSVSPSSINMSRLGIVCWHSYHPWLLPIPQRFGPRNQGIFLGNETTSLDPVTMGLFNMNGAWDPKQNNTNIPSARWGWGSTVASSTSGFAGGFAQRYQWGVAGTKWRQPRREYRWGLVGSISQLLWPWLGIWNYSSTVHNNDWIYSHIYIYIYSTMAIYWNFQLWDGFGDRWSAEFMDCFRVQEPSRMGMYSEIILRYLGVLCQNWLKGTITGTSDIW